MARPQPHIEDLIKELKAEIIQAIKDSSVSVRYMSLKQAATYSGIGQKQLIKLAKVGQIKAVRRRELKRQDWSFDKESIDKYWHQPFEKTKVKAKRILDQIRIKA